MVPVGGKTYRATMRFVPTGGSTGAFDVSGSVMYGNAPNVFFHDFFFQNTGPFVDTFTFFGSSTTSYLTIYLGILTSPPWVGNVFFDNITIQ